MKQTAKFYSVIVLMVVVFCAGWWASDVHRKQAAARERLRALVETPADLSQSEDEMLDFAGEVLDVTDAAGVP